MTICILGRQPALGLAELESLYGAKNVRSVGDSFALVDAEVDFSRLGGTVKAANYLTTLETVKPEKVFEYWRKEIAANLSNFPEGKLKIGVSLYGYSLPVPKINAHMLSLKKVVKNAGRSVRIIPNAEPELSSAQTYHNQLTSPLGMEMVFIREGSETILGQVSHVQDINAYRRRDHERPKRDTYVGMLPPKLAQIIINLAAGDKTSGVVLDPFCGTGVLLQEAALMTYEVYGSDVEEKMVRYTRDNLNWLKEKGTRTQIEFSFYLEAADATEHIWRKPIDIVACEGYLGHPFANEPSKEALKETIQTSNVIMKKFLQNISAQLEPGTRLCIAAPAWHVKDQVHHLPVLETIQTFGFEQILFQTAESTDLIYRRDDQVVGRELVVLTKKIEALVF
jgi:tRNA G10  N-methylase Trm11